MNGALWLARIAANEDSRPLRSLGDGGGTAGELTEDWYGVMQVAGNLIRFTRGSPVDAVRRMSPRVGGLKPSLVHAHIMSRSLPAMLVPLGAGRYEPPPNWREALDGPWNLYGPNWNRARKAVERAVFEGFDAPCDGEPIAEGSPQDDKYALRRKLVRLDCGEVLRFWGSR